MRGPFPQAPVQFVDPLGENGELVGPLDRLGGVAMVAHHPAVVFDLDLEEVVALPQTIQLGSEVLPRRVRGRFGFLDQFR